MKGHSGAFFQRNGGILSKYSYEDRLLEQARRQAAFRTGVPNLSACRIVGTDREGHAVRVDMEYIDGVCPLHHEKPMMLTIFEYIYERYNASTLGNVPADVLLEKLEKIERRIWIATFTPPIWQIPFSECRAVFRDGLKNVPLGDCHGDFTFTNMLQTDTSLVLFDFLDNVFDSILLDMVKLRQDTAHRWANVVLDRKVDEVKLKQIDNEVAKELRWYECYRNYYRALQQYNLLRILPYSIDPKVTNHVLTELNNL
jgi:hypothetical protein